MGWLAKRHLWNGGQDPNKRIQVGKKISGRQLILNVAGESVVEGIQE